MAVPVGLILLLYGHYQDSRIATYLGIGFLAPIAVPVILVIVLVLLALGLGFGGILPIVMARRWTRRRREMKQVLELDRLAASGADRALLWERMRGLKNPEPEIHGEFASRFLDPQCRYREFLISYAGAVGQDQVALRQDDPMGPQAWYLGLCRRYNVNRMHAGFLVRVREQVDQEELRQLWKRALATPEPWLLPPELEVHEDIP